MQFVFVVFINFESIPLPKSEFVYLTQIRLELCSALWRCCCCCPCYLSLPPSASPLPVSVTSSESRPLEEPRSISTSSWVNTKHQSICKKYNYKFDDVRGLQAGGLPVGERDVLQVPLRQVPLSQCFLRPFHRANHLGPHRDAAGSEWRHNEPEIHQLHLPPPHTWLLALSVERSVVWGPVSWYLLYYKQVVNFRKWNTDLEIHEHDGQDGSYPRHTGLVKAG